MTTMTVRTGRALACAFAVLLACAPAASAAPVSSRLTASNGEGTFNATLPCPTGDGPSWRYAYSGAAEALAGPLQGPWRGSFEVHDAGGGAAFIPELGGAVRVGGVHGGELSAVLGEGGCDRTPLALGTTPAGDPVASGPVPFTVTGGQGALRGATGGGTASVELQLGPGADNHATVVLSGDVDALDPAPGGTSVHSRYNGLTNWLNRRLDVGVGLKNDGPGDAFELELVDPRIDGRPATAAKVGVGTVPAGGTAGAGLRFNGVGPSRTVTLTFTLKGRDAADAPIPDTPVSLTFRTPGGFSL